MICSLTPRLGLLRASVTTKSLSHFLSSSKYLSSSKPLAGRINLLQFSAYQADVSCTFIPAVRCRFFCKEAQPVESSTNASQTKEADTSIFTNIDYAAITNNDPALLEKLKIILSEIFFMYEEGMPVPSDLETEHYQELLRLRGANQRNRYLKYLFGLEKSAELLKAKKLKKWEAYVEFKEKKKNEPEETDGKLVYDLSHNSLFIRIYPTSMDRYNNFTLHQASMFAPKVVIDCGYDAVMSRREVKLTVKQLTGVLGSCRTHLSPPHFVFCSYNKESEMAQGLHKNVPSIYEPHYPFYYYSESYLDLFPKERLVYLTPHCRTELSSINSDDVYIIGAMVDMENQKHLSSTKAKEQGIRMAKFPLDQHLLWGTGTKNLTVNQSMMIMAEMYWKNDWKFAFDRWVPKRLLMRSDHPSFSAKMQAVSREGGKFSQAFKRSRFYNNGFTTDKGYREDFYSLRRERPSWNSSSDSRTKLLPRRQNKFDGR